MTEAEAVARTVVEAMKPLVEMLEIAEKAAQNAVDEAILPAMSESRGVSKAYEGFLNTACQPFLNGSELQSQIEIEVSKIKGVMAFAAEWNRAQSKRNGRE